ncbi:MAG: hypothetical protein SNJ29_10025, partial [Rikenellaceae bacterium]
QQEKSSYEMMFEEMKASNKDLKERLERLNDKVVDDVTLRRNLGMTIGVHNEIFRRRNGSFARLLQITLKNTISKLESLSELTDRLEKSYEQFKVNEAEKNRHTFTISFKLSRDLYIFLFLVFTQLVSTIVLLMIKI